MLVEPWEEGLAHRLKSAFPDAIRQTLRYLGQNFAVVEPQSLVAAIRHLKLNESFDVLIDLTAVDYPKRQPRFELVYELLSMTRRERLRLKTRLADGEKAPSIVDVHPGANWLEREVFDMFGIVFDGHPNLKRILLPDDWTGHPLRKEHGITAMDNDWVQRNLSIESGQ